MRTTIGKPAKARKGDLVIFHMRLPRRTKLDCRLSIWSACEGDPLSPHVQHSVLGTVKDGRPSFVQPMCVRLMAHCPDRTITVIADEALTFAVIQDVDVRGDPLAKIRVKVYGRFGQECRRALGHVRRFLWRGSSTSERRYS